MLDVLLKMSCTPKMNKKLNGARRCGRPKGKKGRHRRRRLPLTFAESPQEGECSSVSQVLGALRPISASSTCLDSRAAKKWVSPQFTKEFINNLNRKPKNFSRCARTKKGQHSIMRQDQESTSHSISKDFNDILVDKNVSRKNNLEDVNENLALCRHKEPSCLLSRDTGSPPKESFTFEEVYTGNFGTPEYKGLEPSLLKKNLHHIFSGVSPKLCATGTLLVKDTP